MTKEHAYQISLADLDVHVARTCRRGWLLLSAVITIALAVGVAFLVANPQAPASAPLPTGLSFVEHFDGGELAARGWVTDSSHADATISSENPYAGRGSLRIESRVAATFTVLRRLDGIHEGHRYDVAAFARALSGRHTLRLEFLDGSGRSVGGHDAATPETNTWSRVALSGVAPNKAVHANVVLTSTLTKDSPVLWDELRVVDSTMPNSDLEDWVGDQPAGWDLSSIGGAHEVRSEQSRTRRYALQLPAGPETGWAKSPLVPVLPNGEYTISFWHRTSTGRAQVRATWFGEDKKPLVGKVQPLSASEGQWAEARYREPAPDGAAFLSVWFRLDGADQAMMTIDDLTAAPAAGSGDPAYDTREVARLNGFLTTTTFTIVSVGHAAKFTTIVSGEPASLQMSDLATGKLEYVRSLPDLSNGWALTTTADGALVYLGGGRGHLYVFDPAARSLTDLGRPTPNVDLIWDLDAAPDGRIWGASYPKGEVWSYDPASERFMSLGSAAPGSDYGRSIAVDTSHVYVGTGPNDPKIVAIPIDAPDQRKDLIPPMKFDQGFVYELAVQGRVLAARFPDGYYALYDLQARQWHTPSDLAASVGPQFPVLSAERRPFALFADGQLWEVAADELVPLARVPDLPKPRHAKIVRTTIRGRDGSWLIGYDGGYRVTLTQLPLSESVEKGEPPTLRSSSQQLKLRPATLRIKSLALGDDGLLYVGGFGGPSLSAFTVQGRQVTRYPRQGEIGEGVIGEIEGMIGHGRYQYLGSYTGARILRFDTSRPWNDENNPLQVTALGPSMEQDRPVAWAVSGGRVYFGTVPKYGVLTGAIGWIDDDAARATSVRSPVQDQSVVSLAARGSVLYAGTSRWGGLGSTPRSGSGGIFAYDTERRQLLWSVPQPGAEAVSSMHLTGSGQLWAVAGSDLIEVNPTSGETIRRLHLRAAFPTKTSVWAVTQLTESNGRLVLAAFGGLYTIDPTNLRVVAVQRSGVAPNKVTASSDTLFFPTDTRLMAAERRTP